MMVGWAILGIVFGAAGAEFLRRKKPELIENVEDAARRFADSLCSSKSKKDSASQTEENADVGLDEHPAEEVVENESQPDNVGD